MYKKALSGVVVTIILILLSLVALAILASLFLGIVTDISSDVNLPNYSKQNYTIDGSSIPSDNFADATLKLKELGYDNSNIGLFKSSLHLKPMDSYGSSSYASAFPDHETVRLPNVGYNLYTSTSKASFLTNLQNNNLVKNQYMRDTHEVFIIPVHGLPEWLTGHVEEGYTPVDYQQWEDVVRDMTTYFSQFSGVELYFEIGNEPDLIEFWKGNTNDYLVFYEHTAKAIKEVNPNAKVGGAGLNQYFGKAYADGNNNAVDNLNVELIEYAKTNNLPLDFISWHNYRTMGDIGVAKTTYTSALTSSGYSTLPELIITEWNGPTTALRQSSLNPALAADSYLGFYEYGIDRQVFYTWQDEVPESSPDLRYYGAVTQSGTVRPVYYVLALFDQISRTSTGIYYFLSGTDRVIISKNSNGCYTFVVWNLDSSGSKDKEYFLDSNIGSVNGVGIKDGVMSKSFDVEKNRVSFNINFAEVVAFDLCTI